MRRPRWPWALTLSHSKMYDAGTLCRHTLRPDAYRGCAQRSLLQTGRAGPGPAPRWELAAEMTMLGGGAASKVMWVPVHVRLRDSVLLFEGPRGDLPGAAIPPLPLALAIVVLAPDAHPQRFDVYVTAALGRARALGY
jgi:hypothetical protein